MGEISAVKHTHWHPDNHEDKEKRWYNLCTSCHSPLKMSLNTSRKAERAKRWKEHGIIAMTAITAHHMQRKTNKGERERERGFFLAFQSIFGFWIIFQWFSFKPHAFKLMYEARCYDAWIIYYLSTSTNFLKSSVMPIYFYRTYKCINVIIQRN